MSADWEKGWPPLARPLPPPPPPPEPPPAVNDETIESDVAVQFEAVVAPTGYGSTLSINGRDVSSAVRAFSLQVNVEGSTLTVECLSPAVVRGAVDAIHIAAKMTVIVLDGEPQAVCETLDQAKAFFRDHPRESIRYETFIVPCWFSDKR